MIVSGKIAEVRRTLDEARASGRTIGFVPTMGALHEGHLSLVREARRANDVVCVSIFVNPMQFGPSEDLDAYPRPIDDDLRACEGEGVDVVFAPDAHEMYTAPPTTGVDVGPLAEPMEGRFRPGHFAGVALVCTKLFAIVGPCAAYFGEKDAQQLRVVRRLVRDLSLPVDVEGCPTVRDPDGLALSSRNAYLSPDERKRASALSRGLFAMQDLLDAGERDASVLLEEGRSHLDDADAVDYLEVREPETLELVGRLDGPALALGAIRVGEIRLIDNVRLEPRGEG